MNTMYCKSIKGSLMATTLHSGFSMEARKTNRPIRPKLRRYKINNYAHYPLIPIFIGIN